MHLYWQHYKPSLVGFYLVIDDTNLESCSVIAVADPLLDTFLWEVGEQTGVASAPLGCSLTTDFSPPDAAERTKPLLHAAVNHLISACGAQVPALPPVSPLCQPSAGEISSGFSRALPACLPPSLCLLERPQPACGVSLWPARGCKQGESLYIFPRMWCKVHSRGLEEISSGLRLVSGGWFSVTWPG